MVTTLQTEVPSEKWYLEPMVEVSANLSTKSEWTWDHSGRVARYAMAFGKKIGLDEGQMMALHCAALLHDVGKVVVPPELLNKESKLSLDEWYSITKHPMASARIIRSCSIAAEVAGIARSHHEWFNGNGYPMGLQGDAIPLGARILSLADACDAMSSDRPYRAALDPEQMIEELNRGAGRQFDPVLITRLRPYLQADLCGILPRNTMRVVSDDPSLIRQLWFALYPLGWDFEAVPSQSHMASDCTPAETGSSRPSVKLTIIDGRTARETWQGIVAEGGPVVWVDAPDGIASDLQRPLDLEGLLARVRAEQPAPANENIRVLLADPYHLFRQGLKHCLDEQPGIEVVAEVDSAIDFRRLRDKLQHDVAVVASDMIEGTLTAGTLRQNDIPLEETEALHTDPHKPPVIVLVSDGDLDDPRLAPTIWQPGDIVSRNAYIYRGSPAEVLVEIVRTLAMEAEAS